MMAVMIPIFDTAQTELVPRLPNFGLRALGAALPASSLDCLGVHTFTSPHQSTNTLFLFGWRSKDTRTHYSTKLITRPCASTRTSIPPRHPPFGMPFLVPPIKHPVSIPYSAVTLSKSSRNMHGRVRKIATACSRSSHVRLHSWCRFPSF